MSPWCNITKDNLNALAPNNAMAVRKQKKGRLTNDKDTHKLSFEFVWFVEGIVKTLLFSKLNFETDQLWSREGRRIIN